MSFLRTPDSILETARTVFPKADLTVKIASNNDVTMDLKLAPRVTSVTISCIVDREPFIKELDLLQRKIRVQQIVSQETDMDIETRNFSTCEVITQWQRFQRNQFEKHQGKKCIEALVEFLIDTQNLQLSEQVRSLGLAPNQVQVRSEDDFGYFQDLCSEQYKKHPSSAAIISGIETLYPSVYQRLVELEIENNIQKGAKEGNFDRILTRLQGKVIGQAYAVKQIASHLSSQVQSSTTNESFMFVGPSGIGKTELANAVGSESGGRFIYISMEQYMCESKASDLFGSSTGIMGSAAPPLLVQQFDSPKFGSIIEREQGGITYKVVRNIVILFDEIEKAHPKIKQSLLTLFEKFVIQIKYTKQQSALGSYREENLTFHYRFENATFICTSNLYKDLILQMFQNNQDPAKIGVEFKKWNSIIPVADSFSLEFISRFTILPFGPIPRGVDYQKILQKKLTEFFEKIKKEFNLREVVTDNLPAILQLLENKLYNDGTDIRSIEKSYFPRLVVIFHQSKAVWGCLKDVKLTLICQGADLYIKAELFVFSKNYKQIGQLVLLP